MGDRCYMEITCRRKDSEEFESLGFTAHDWNNERADSSTVVMVDEEANYAHYDKMLTNVPYHGHNGRGDNYGDGVFACDGRRYAEVQAGYERGFVVEWDEKKQKPTPQSVRAVRRYLAVRNRVRTMFAKLSAPVTPRPQQ